MELTFIDPLSDPRWRHLVQQAESDIFHSPEWLRVLHSTYAFETGAYLLLSEEGEAVAGWPFCRIEDARGRRIVTLPFSDYCDLLVQSREQWDMLASRVLAEGYPVRLRTLHNMIPLEDERFTLYNRAKWHGLDLHAEIDEIHDAFDARVRRNLRRATRDGVTSRCAENEADLRAFFGLHLRTRKYKYRLLAQPYPFFRNIWEQLVLPGKGILILAELGDRVIGATLFLEWKGTLYYKFNASDPDFLSHRPNELMMWEGIRYAKQRGLNYLDFGLSDWDQEGLLHYKRKYNTEEKTISFLQHLPEGVPQSRAPGFQALLPKLTELFTDPSVPDPITEQAGDLLYQYFV